MTPRPETLARVKKVIGQSLRLGDGADISDDMPLIGGQHDLDSLDVLLVVTGMEKEFGIKIRDGEIGRQLFTDVSTLATYIEAQRP
jgi:acyl carrier protein